MQMKIISEKSEIENCQKILIDNLKKTLTKCLHKKIKVPFKKVDKAIHNGHLWFAFDNERKKNHYWNVFGLVTSYREEKVIAEINPPKDIRRLPGRRPSGVFAKDDNDKKYILHRGDFTKGRQRIKEETLAYFRNKNHDICELNDGQEAILVSSLEDDSPLVDNITEFVENVHDFKKAMLNKFPDS